MRPWGLWTEGMRCLWAGDWPQKEAGEKGRQRGMIKAFRETPWYEEYRRVQDNPAYGQGKMLRALSDLVGRVIGERWRDSFVFRQEDIHSANGNDAFELQQEDNRIVICGPNGISMASGLNHYLKKYALVNFNPLFASNVKMPERLPALTGRIRRSTSYDVRYALNFCTYSYTMAFWGWKEYEALLDWFALNGVNLMLDIVGQEEVQRRFLREYGYSEEEIGAYIPGPAYLPWFFMQNMSGFGGPLPEKWFEQRVELARRMHDRMQAFGIRPVLMGFAGMVPGDFGAKHPEASVIEQGLWCGFSRPAMLRVCGSEGKDCFGPAADTFYAKQEEVFGPITHYYAVDPFHEGGKMGDMDPTAVYHRVQRKMLEHDPQAVWLLMQWQGQITDAKLSGLCRPEQALVLDLQADRRPYHAMMERHKVPWIWSMVHNFGGRMGVDGDVVTLARDIPAAWQGSSYMKGIGAAPEAFDSGPIMYDLLFDMAWEDGPVDCGQYVREYAKSRYGGSDSHLERAWDILLHTAYWKKDMYAQGAGESVINARPSETFRSASTWGHSAFEYDQKALEQALPELIAAYDDYQDSETFRYDLVDVAKQILSNAANSLHRQMMAAYYGRNLELFEKLSGKFLDLIRLEDRILGFCPDFTLENWIQASRSVLAGADEQEKDLFEFNARALITTWGDYQNSEDCLLDYSNRQWAGVTESYCLKRWEDFVRRYTDSLKTGREPEPFAYFPMEWEWANRKTREDAPEHATSGDSLKMLAEKVFREYSQTAMERDEAYQAVSEPVNLALGLQVTGSMEADPAYPYANLTDGRLDTVWKAAKVQWPVSLTIDLGRESYISRIEFSMPQVAGDFPLSYSVEVFEKGAWTALPVAERETLLGTIYVPCSCIASGVRLSLREKQPWGLPAELAGFSVYGFERPSL